MKTYLVLLVILFSVSSIFSQSGFPEEEGVLVLDDANFDEAVKKYENLLVEFYAPWCGHCKELAPHYAKAAQTLKSDPTPLFLAKVDATISTELAKKHEIEGFPTLKFFRNGEPEEYSGGRTEQEIVAWMRKKTGPASTVFTTVKEITNMADNNEVAAVFFGTEENLHKDFLELARQYDDIQFGECATEECLSNWKVTNGNVIVFRKFDPNNAELRTAYTKDELKSFVDQNSTKLVASFDEKTAQLIFGKQVPGLFFYRAKGSDSEAKFDELAASVAEELKGKIQVVVTDIQEGLEQRLAEYVGITATELPTVRIHDTREDLKKYNLEEEATKENIMKFVKDWLDGKLVPKMKSEDESVTTSATTNVIPLVGLNFAQYAYDKNKDVLVEFYAPWCGHCQKLTPIYEELATKMKDTNPNILIAKVDATANDVEGQDIQGFPTIRLFLKNDKENAVEFDGERDLSGLVDFLQQKVTDFNRPEGIPASVPRPEGEGDDSQEGGDEGSEGTEGGEGEEHSHDDGEGHDHGHEGEEETKKSEEL